MLPPVILTLKSTLNPTLVTSELPSSYEFLDLFPRSHGFIALFPPTGPQGPPKGTRSAAQSLEPLAQQRHGLGAELGLRLPGLPAPSSWAGLVFCLLFAFKLLVGFGFAWLD